VHDAHYAGRSLGILAYALAVSLTKRKKTKKKKKRRGEDSGGRRRHGRGHGSRFSSLRFCFEYLALSRVQISEECTSRVRVEVLLILLASLVVGCCFCIVLLF
jgi:hypothetical protein